MSLSASASSQLCCELSESIGQRGCEKMPRSGGEIWGASVRVCVPCVTQDNITSFNAQLGPFPEEARAATKHADHAQSRACCLLGLVHLELRAVCWHEPPQTCLVLSSELACSVGDQLRASSEQPSLMQPTPRPLPAVFQAPDTSNYTPSTWADAIFPPGGAC